MADNDHIEINQDDDNDIAIDIDACTRVIAELCTSAPNNLVRDCIRTYDPTKTTPQIKRMLNSLNKPILIQTLSYLFARTIDNKIKKDDLLDMLIMKIKSYFPDFCQLCNHSYCFKFGDDPFLACQSCGQEVHKPCYFNLLASMNLLSEKGTPKDLIFKIPGICFLCSRCESDVIIDKKDFCTDEVGLGKVSKSDNDISGNEIVNDNIHGQVFISNPDDNIENVSVRENENIIPETVPNVNNVVQNNDIDSQVPSRSTQWKTKICRFYKRGNCKYGRKGEECPFDHPLACRKLLSHGNKGPRGCTLGSNCDKYHPRMCAASITKGECFNNHCNFTHVKGTKRSSPTQNQPAADFGNPLLDRSTSQNHAHPQNNFLELLHNFREDIMNIINTKLRQTQLAPPHPPFQQHTPDQIQPVIQNQHPVFPLNNQFYMKPSFNSYPVPHLNQPPVTSQQNTLIPPLVAQPHMPPPPMPPIPPMPPMPPVIPLPRMY